jgi:hypothetical protein
VSASRRIFDRDEIIQDFSGAAKTNRKNICRGDPVGRPKFMNISRDARSEKKLFILSYAENFWPIKADFKSHEVSFLLSYYF